MRLFFFFSGDALGKGVLTHELNGSTMRELGSIADVSEPDRPYQLFETTKAYLEEKAYFSLTTLEMGTLDSFRFDTFDQFDSKYVERNLAAYMFFCTHLLRERLAG